MLGDLKKTNSIWVYSRRFEYYHFANGAKRSKKPLGQWEVIRQLLCYQIIHNLFIIILSNYLLKLPILL